MTVDNAALLLASWTVSLRAARKSPKTIDTYAAGVRLYLRWAVSLGLGDVLDRRSVELWLAELADAGAAGDTIRIRQAALRGFTAWLTDEGELDRDPLRTMAAVKVDAKVVPSLSEPELAALLKACKGPDLADRRDEALLRFMVDTGARAGEVVAMERGDVDLQEGVATIRRGKGGKGRRVPFGNATAAALDRYLRARRSHALADSPALWLGRTALTYSGLRDALQARSRVAGVADFHLHRLRHTAATRWLAAGGTEGGLMALGGWKRRDLIDRYTADSAERRLAAERRNLGLPDL